MKTIDHYAGAEYGSRAALFERERVARDLVRPLLQSGMRLLDIGCGDGMFLTSLQSLASDLELHGVDYSADRLAQTKSKDLHLKQCDLHDGIPFDADAFDLIYCGEVIEHLWDPDALVKEMARVLRPGGSLVLTTPNLCAWYNRWLFLFGIQPIFIESSTVDGSIGTGPLRHLKKQSRPVGHVRIFNRAAVVDLLHAYGFRVSSVRGASFERLPPPMRQLDRQLARLSSFASNLVIQAQRI